MTTTTRKAKPHQRYYLGEQLVPGVTTILGVLNKPALVPWANRLGLEGIKTTEYVDHLADIGTLAHRMIQCHLTGEELDLSDYTPNQVSAAENAVLSFFEWEKGKELETIRSEAQLVSETHKYGGTVDWYGTINGQAALVDIKTGKAIYDEMVYQVAAYAQLLVENNYSLKEVRILQVGRDETEGFSERVIPIGAILPYFVVFKSALDLYNAIKAAKRRK
jgi:hypothetical protein